MDNLMDHLGPLLENEELVGELTVLPPLRPNAATKSDRLLALMDIYKVFIPNRSTVEVYNNLYLAVANSLEKKGTVDEAKLVNDAYLGRGNKKYGVIGGLDSFKITGTAGVGKTSTVNRCIDLIARKRVIVIGKTKREILPFLVVECPADGSFKSLLYSILQQVDKTMGSHYFESNSGRYITVDYLLSVVSVILINHVGVLVIDEVERVASESAKGATLINYLTQLVNQTDVGVCFVGNESANAFFSMREYMGRRTIGISVKRLDYGQFIGFCERIFPYQYTSEHAQLTSDIAQLLFKMTDGIPSMIVALFVEAQKYAILRDALMLTPAILEETYKASFQNVAPFIDRGKETKPKQRRREGSEELKGPTARRPGLEAPEHLFADCAKRSNKDIDVLISVLSKQIKVEFLKNE